MAETLVKLPEHLVENNLIRVTFAEAWDTCHECKLLFHAVIVAAI